MSVVLQRSENNLVLLLHLVSEPPGENLLPFSLPISSFPNSIPSKEWITLLTLGSELALLLVAKGESETLAVRLFVGPDLTLYIEDAGMLVIKGLKLFGMLRRISCFKGNHPLDADKSWNTKKQQH